MPAASKPTSRPARAAASASLITCARVGAAGFGDADWSGVAQAASSKALARQVAAVGNNLNQVAKWANTYKTDAEARQVLAVLVSIERILLSYRPMPGGHDEGEVPDAG